MGAGNDTIVFVQNSLSDFTLTNTASGLQITNNSNANIDFTVSNAEHLYFVGSNESYDIATTAVQTGIIIDGIIEGMAYETSSGLTGYTKADGSFNYVENDTVTFKIGNIVIGSIEANTIQDNQVFLQDLANVERTDVNDEYVENMAVLLQSLDVDSDAYNGIVITEAMHEAFSNKDFDLSTITEEELTAIIEETGHVTVSEDAAMEHVQDMLEVYANLSEESFDIRISDDVVDGLVTNNINMDTLPNEITTTDIGLHTEVTQIAMMDDILPPAYTQATNENTQTTVDTHIESQLNVDPTVVLTVDDQIYVDAV